MATLVENRKARFDYEILETYEAGIELLGFEVKSLKKGQGSLEGAYVIIRGGEAYAVNMSVPPYQEKNTPPEYEPRRNRRLILRKKEIRELADVARGLTIVPISVYNKGSLVKVSLAVVRGKKQFDKRTAIKKREVDREVRREFSDR
ncbi:MAG: SsrA-binding protein SmpB [Patescibacteria group bacterium]|nr:SsrA-binding protein SmpB [Patescibacteria group bacterium]MDE2172664.1 SsrA-binding protein SmpB [Patescibacteria group bacterium]